MRSRIMDEKVIERLKEVELNLRSLIARIKDTELANDQRVLNIIDEINALSVEI